LETSLPLIWAVLIAAAVFLCVVLDGFDLEIGILFPVERGKAERPDDEYRCASVGWQSDLAGVRGRQLAERQQAVHASHGFFAALQDWQFNDVRQTFVPLVRLKLKLRMHLEESPSQKYERDTEIDHDSRYID
jgi:hypothetical protein